MRFLLALVLGYITAVIVGAGIQFGWSGNNGAIAISCFTALYYLLAVVVTQKETVKVIEAPQARTIQPGDWVD